MRRLVTLCEAGKYDKALELIQEQINKGDVSSELFRIQGQVFFDLERFDDSLNALIESLKLEEKNLYSLILIGNIYGTVKKDINTALTYYKKVLESDASDTLSLSNIGSVLAMNDKLVEAAGYFEKALSINSNFPNALFGMALLNYNQNNLFVGFDYIIKCLKYLPYKNENNKIRLNAENLAVEIAKKYAIQYSENDHQNVLLDHLIKVSDKPIISIEDDSIDTPAKLEVAEYRGKDRHIIKYKEDSILTPHYMFHELMHLELIFDARKENANKLFTSSNKQFELFKRRHKEISSNLSKKGLEAAIEGLYEKLFNGLNLQLYNAPIDLFIEDSIFLAYSEIKPIQFLSIKGMIETVFEGYNSSALKGIVPEKIKQKNLILAIPQMILFNELFGIDYTQKVKDKFILTKGKNLYNDFLELRKDKAEGEEYDMIRWWAEELNLKSYFNLVPEELNKESLGAQVERIESDPFNLDGDSSFEEEELNKFIEANRQEGLNMAVVFHMVDAMKYIKDLDADSVQKIGFEIATVGRLGIDPNKDDKYSLDSVKGRTFSGWQMLSWMYVTWKRFNPVMADQLGLEFGQEYQLATSLA